MFSFNFLMLIKNEIRKLSTSNIFSFFSSVSPTFNKPRKSISKKKNAQQIFKEKLPLSVYRQTSLINNNVYLEIFIYTHITSQKICSLLTAKCPEIIWRMKGEKNIFPKKQCASSEEWNTSTYMHMLKDRDTLLCKHYFPKKKLK